MTAQNKRVKLTKNFIDSLPLEPAIYRDSELIGFGVRIQRTYKTYIVEKKVKGRSVRHVLGIVGQMTLAQARHKASIIFKNFAFSSTWRRAFLARPIPSAPLAESQI